LTFDFYLPEYNCCIEYDGKQHFEAIKWFGGEESLAYVQQNDLIKTQYCQNNKIALLRIRYNQDIKETLDNFFQIVKDNYLIERKVIL
jgi:hypothetical protein